MQCKDVTVKSTVYFKLTIDGNIRSHGKVPVFYSVLVCCEEFRVFEGVCVLALK